MMSYIAIIITGILGVLGLIYKSKKDDKPGKLNPLNPGGYAVLLLLIILPIIGCFVQYSKDTAADVEKAKAREKAKNDALIHHQRYATDSMLQMLTIAKLNNQIYNDSTRFNITLSNFGKTLSGLSQGFLQQKMSFEKQFEIIENAEHIQHPLFPLKIKARVAVYLENMPSEKTYLFEYLERMVSPRITSPEGWIDPFPNGYDNDDDNDDDDDDDDDDNRYDDPSTYDKYYYESKAFIYNLIPDVCCFFFKDTINTSFDLSIYGFGYNIFLSEKKHYDKEYYKIDYAYYSKEKYMLIDIYFIASTYNKYDKSINSLYNFKKGYIKINLDVAHKFKTELKSMQLTCGNSYSDRYKIYFNKKNTISTRYGNRYIVQVSDLLNNRSIPLE